MEIGGMEYGDSEILTCTLWSNDEEVPKSPVWPTHSQGMSGSRCQMPKMCWASARPVRLSEGSVQLGEFFTNN